MIKCLALKTPALLARDFIQAGFYLKDTMEISRKYCVFWGLSLDNFVQSFFSCVLFGLSYLIVNSHCVCFLGCLYQNKLS